MTRGAGSLTRAYVLHTRAWRNTSLIVEAFTAEAGRVGVVARGVRRPSNPSRAYLQPFQPLLIAWSGRGELHSLTSVEAEQWRAPPEGRRLLAGFYCNELLLRLLERQDPHPEVFAAYDEAVTALAATETADEAILRRFELELLDGLGFAPPLAIEADSGEAVDPAADYDFLPEHGPVRAVGPPGQRSLRVPGAHLLALAGHGFDDTGTLRTARRVLRASLAPLLGPKPLKSRELYRSMYGGDRS